MKQGRNNNNTTSFQLFSTAGGTEKNRRFARTPGDWASLASDRYSNSGDVQKIYSSRERRIIINIIIYIYY